LKATKTKGNDDVYEEWSYG